MTMADVTVLGAGVFGLSVAWCCVERGARVRMVETRRPGAGASGGVLGALAPHTPDGWNAKKQFQFDALTAAPDFWARVEAASGIATGFGRIGRLQPLADARGVELARARADAAAATWRGEAAWRLVPARADGWAPASPAGWLVEDTLSARIRPADACRALAAAITARGGEIVAEAAPGGVTVLATGHEGLATLSAELGQPVGAGVKGQAMLLAHEARDRPQVFAEGLHIVPHDDGTVAIGSTSERDWDDPAATDDQIEALHARAVAICPALADAPVLRRWAGVRPRARSRAPMLGPHPRRAGVYIANGGFKIGLGLAPEVGAVMADLVLDGRDRIPPEFTVETNLRP